MHRYADRVFWSLLLLMHAASLAAALVGAGGLSMTSRVLATGFEAVVLLACIGLIAGRRMFRHDTWARIFGIATAAGVTGLLSLASTAVHLDARAVTLPGAMLGLVELLTGVFALFVYTFGSPRIWPPAPRVE
jgi:hypothetical protein